MSDNTESSKSLSYAPLRMVELLPLIQAALQEEESWSPNTSVDNISAAEVRDDETAKENIKSDVVKPQPNISSTTNSSFGTQKTVRMLHDFADASNNHALNDSRNVSLNNSGKSKPHHECSNAVNESAENSGRPWYIRPAGSAKKPTLPSQLLHKTSLFSKASWRSADESSKATFFKQPLFSVEEQDSPQSDATVSPYKTSTPLKPTCHSTNIPNLLSSYRNDLPPSAILLSSKKSITAISDDTSPPNLQSSEKQTTHIPVSLSLSKLQPSVKIAPISSISTDVLSITREDEAISAVTPKSSVSAMSSMSNVCSSAKMSPSDEQPIVQPTSAPSLTLPASDGEETPFNPSFLPIAEAYQNSDIAVSNVLSDKPSVPLDSSTHTSVLSSSIKPQENTLKSHIPTAVPPISCSCNVEPSQCSIENTRETKQECQKASEAIPKIPQFRSLAVNGKPYTILGKLGIGGSSEVLKVLDPVDSSLYAIKCVNLAVEAALAQGYINEIRLLKKLQGSERVVTMYDYEYVEKIKMLHVVMELGDTDLAKLLKSHVANRRLPGPLVLAYWVEMLFAVDHIHANGIIHFDLKPANFLLVQGRLKLIDFGIASAISLDATSVIKDAAAGTFNYISPEALVGQQGGEQIKISCKSDVWSLGCILYSLVYGKTPFSHITNKYAKMAAIGNPEQLIDYPNVSHVPQVLIHALKWCLTFDPKKRPSVKELMALPYMETSSPREIPSSIQRKIQAALTPEEWQAVCGVLWFVNNR